MRAIARDAGISVAYLSKIEHDEANPTIDVLRRVASALEVGVDEFTVSGDNKSVPSATLPETLAQFIDEQKDKYPELDKPEWREMLLGIRLRGQYPVRQDDWLMLFLAARNAWKK
jgi:transcriptional regulator with XRE-family HTH domain